MSETTTQINAQLNAHEIEFGEKLRDPASGFEGEVQVITFYKHGCMRVWLRGVNKTTGEPAEFSFDAPELERISTEEKVATGPRTGGPHGLHGDSGRVNVR